MLDLQVQSLRIFFLPLSLPLFLIITLSRVTESKECKTQTFLSVVATIYLLLFSLRLHYNPHCYFWMVSFSTAPWSCSNVAWQTDTHITSLLVHKAKKKTQLFETFKLAHVGPLIRWWVKLMLLWAREVYVPPRRALKRNPVCLRSLLPVWLRLNSPGGLSK